MESARKALARLRAGNRRFVCDDLIQSGQLVVVGAEYSVETGVVEFFDDLPKLGATD